MQSPKLSLLYGVYMWAALIITSLILRVYETGDSPLFESLKFVVLASVAVCLVVQYVRKVKKPSALEGLLVGGSWLVVTVVLDLVLFALGLFNLSLGDYFSDVVTSYLIMPIVAMLIMAKLKAK